MDLLKLVKLLCSGRSRFNNNTNVDPADPLDVQRCSEGIQHKQVRKILSCKIYRLYILVKYFSAQTCKILPCKPATWSFNGMEVHFEENPFE